MATPIQNIQNIQNVHYHFNGVFIGGPILHPHDRGVEHSTRPLHAENQPQDDTPPDRTSRHGPKPIAPLPPNSTSSLLTSWIQSPTTLRVSLFIGLLVAQSKPEALCVSVALLHQLINSPTLPSQSVLSEPITLTSRAADHAEDLPIQPQHWCAPRKAALRTPEDVTTMFFRSAGDVTILSTMRLVVHNAITFPWYATHCAALTLRHDYRESNAAILCSLMPLLLARAGYLDIVNKVPAVQETAIPGLPGVAMLPISGPIAPVSEHTVEQAAKEDGSDSGIKAGVTAIVDEPVRPSRTIQNLDDGTSSAEDRISDQPTISEPEYATQTTSQTSAVQDTNEMDMDLSSETSSKTASPNTLNILPSSQNAGQIVPYVGVTTSSFVGLVSILPAQLSQKAPQSPTVHGIISNQDFRVEANDAMVITDDIVDSISNALDGVSLDSPLGLVYARALPRKLLPAEHLEKSINLPYSTDMSYAPVGQNGTSLASGAAVTAQFENPEYRFRMTNCDSHYTVNGSSEASSLSFVKNLQQSSASSQNAIGQQLLGPGPQQRPENILTAQSLPPTRTEHIISSILGPLAWPMPAPSSEYAGMSVNKDGAEDVTGFRIMPRSAANTRTESANLGIRNSLISAGAEGRLAGTTKPSADGGQAEGRLADLSEAQTSITQTNELTNEAENQGSGFLGDMVYEMHGNTTRSLAETNAESKSRDKGKRRASEEELREQEFREQERSSRRPEVPPQDSLLTAPPPIVEKDAPIIKENGEGPSSGPEYFHQLQDPGVYGDSASADTQQAFKHSSRLSVEPPEEGSVDENPDSKERQRTQTLDSNLVKLSEPPSDTLILPTTDYGTAKATPSTPQQVSIDSTNSHRFENNSDKIKRWKSQGPERADWDDPVFLNMKERWEQSGFTRTNSPVSRSNPSLEDLYLIEEQADREMKRLNAGETKLKKLPSSRNAPPPKKGALKRRAEVPADEDRMPKLKLKKLPRSKDAPPPKKGVLKRRVEEPAEVMPGEPGENETTQPSPHKKTSAKKAPSSSLPDIPDFDFSDDYEVLKEILATPIRSQRSRAGTPRRRRSHGVLEGPRGLVPAFEASSSDFGIDGVGQWDMNAKSTPSSADDSAKFLLSPSFLETTRTDLTPAANSPSNSPPQTVIVTGSAPAQANLTPAANSPSTPPPQTVVVTGSALVQANLVAGQKRRREGDDSLAVQGAQVRVVAALPLRAKRMKSA